MNNFTETVRNSADILRVVSDYVTLKGTGSRLMGLCPFHSERTPSFTVHRDKQFFHCFGCHAGGDVFSFVMMAEKVSFPEAVEILAEKFGITVPAKGLDSGKSGARKSLIEIHERAAAYFQEALAMEEAAPARAVIAQRQVQPSMVKRFGLGYAPAGGLLNHLKLKDPLSSGLFVKNDRGEVYDRFRRRLMFPIWNERGRIVGFGGRALLPDAQPKYLNSPESPLYSKSHLLYGMHFARDAARKAGRLVVVEGYFDCLSLHQAGIENVVASCGTALTEHQAALMARYVPEVVMNYDPDTAGQNAMRRSIDLLLAKGLRVRILKLEGGLDPDDYVRKEGGEVYARLLAGAPYFWQYLMTEAAHQYDLNDPAAKATAVGSVLQHVAKIGDRVEQLEIARSVAAGFKVPEPLILERLRLSAGGREVQPLVRPSASIDTNSRTLTVAEKQLIQALLQGRDIAEALQSFLQAEFGAWIWSRPVLENLARDPARNIEAALTNIDDEALKSAVRAAVLEPFGTISDDQALDSVRRLYDRHLVQKLEEIRQELKQYGSGPAPAELVRRHMELVAERTRVAAFKA
jgi:DNA primase